jgi:hypothetical protein
MNAETDEGYKIAHLQDDNEKLFRSHVKDEKDAQVVAEKEGERPRNRIGSRK